MAVSTISQAGLDAPISLTSPTLTTPNINSAQIPTVSGTAPLYMARAWVNFNGTGTVAIRASGNVSSITDNGTGLYTINFTTAMSDANYSVAGAVSPSGVNAALAVQIFAGTPWATSAPTTSSFSIVTPVSTTNPTDLAYVCLSVFR